MSDSIADSNAVALTLLKINECFLYRIPPMQTSDGHRAELWGLEKPIATCSLTIARRGNELFVDFLAERPKKNAPGLEKYIFAQAQVAVDLKNPSHSIEHWVIPVVDSSRYFAVRISKSGREALIGCGFRERSDAVNFRFSIEDYINSLKREMKANELRQRFEESLEVSGEENEEMLPMPKSSLSLKEGEKIHINIKGKKVSRSPRPKKAPNKFGLTGLKKPPPPPPMNSVTAGDDDNDEWGDFVG
mmetsp:Transcript_29352/g.69834  ORF Transcript_29352/g.69834 Transcript_29352/m.69834 type:complete len:246 (-) Transcript_29352:186-923(-)